MAADVEWRKFERFKAKPGIERELIDDDDEHDEADEVEDVLEVGEIEADVGVVIAVDATTFELASGLVLKLIACSRLLDGEPVPLLDCLPQLGEILGSPLTSAI